MSKRISTCLQGEFPTTKTSDSIEELPYFFLSLWVFVWVIKHLQLCFYSKFLSSILIIEKFLELNTLSILGFRKNHYVSQPYMKLSLPQQSLQISISLFSLPTIDSRCKIFLFFAPWWSEIVGKFHFFTLSMKGKGW